MTNVIAKKYNWIKGAICIIHTCGTNLAFSNVYYHPHVCYEPCI